MKQDDNGNLIHENHNGEFEYKGAIFIIDDYGQDFVPDAYNKRYRITERNFIVGDTGSSLEELKILVKSQYDNYLNKKKK